MNEELKQQVIHYYKTNRENSVPAIMKKFNLKFNQADKIINDYLATKKLAKDDKAKKIRTKHF